MRRIIRPDEVPAELASQYNEYVLSELSSLCTESLLAFQTTFWRVLEPLTPYKDNWHLHFMIEHLEAVEAGQIKRLLLNLPPRCMKSILSNVMFGAWLWARRPEWRMLSFSHMDTISKKFNVHRRNIILSSLYKQLFPYVQLCGDMNTQRKIENTRTGLMIASSIPAGITGEGGDILIVDDPHDPQKAMSDLQRAQAVDYFRETLPSRLNDQKTGAIIVVMQRLHQADVSGVALELDDSYVHVKLPAIERLDRTLIFPISKKEIHRKKGDLLWPEHQGEPELASLKKMLGDYGFAGQYLQEPSPAEGGLVKEEWWQYYTTIKEPVVRYCLSIDAAFKKSEVSDFIVIQRWAVTASGNMYLIDMIRERMSFLETLDAIKTIYKRNDIVYVEAKANGEAIINTLRRSISGVIAYNPTESKIARLQAIVPWIESGSVFLPKYAAWLPTMLEEFKFFPNGMHDDIIDATSQAIIKIKDIRPGAAAEPVVDYVRTFEKKPEQDLKEADWLEEIFEFCEGDY